MEYIMLDCTNVSTNANASVVTDDHLLDGRVVAAVAH
jgi:hypothetical protein